MTNSEGSHRRLNAWNSPKRFFMRTKVCGLLALVTVTGWSADHAIGSIWQVESPHLYRDGLLEGIGFSFTYDGKTIGPSVPEGWAISTRSTSEGLETRLSHSSGLVAVRLVRSFPESEAIEYTVRFRNEGSSVLPILSRVNAMDLAFGKAVLANVSVVTSNGGSGDSLFPPDQYALRERLMGPMLNPPAHAAIRLESLSGKPSRGDLPFFFAQDKHAGRGIFVALGWTGVWEAEIGGDFLKETFSLKGGMPGLSLRLHPGEEISGPIILLGGFRGPFSAGSNRLRRVIRNHYTPLLEGKKPLPVLGYSSWYSVFTNFDDKTLCELADVAAELEQEYFEVDAGWFAGTRQGPGNGQWQYGVGNWEKADPNRFPNGLRPVVDYVKSKGMKFGMWFEPERAVRDSLLGKAHPEWLLWPPRPRDLTSEREWALVNFGLKEVQDWFVELLCRYVREFDLQYLRWDLNVGPAVVWAAHDTPDRLGLTQIRHVEGLNRVMREVLRRNPDLLLENCAGGGGRVDLASMQNGHAFWLTNHSSDPHVVRHFLGGVNHVVPTSYSIVEFELPVWWKKEFEYPDIMFQSYFGGAFGISTRITEWPASMKTQAKRHIQVYKRIRHFLVEDYYRLLPAAVDLSDWEGWQFHDPEKGNGFVQAFRTNSPEAARSLRLFALEPLRSYRFTDPYSGASMQVSGATALSEGIKFDLPEMSSKVLIYEPVPASKK